MLVEPMLQQPESGTSAGTLSRVARSGTRSATAVLASAAQLTSVAAVASNMHQINVI